MKRFLCLYFLLLLLASGGWGSPLFSGTANIPVGGSTCGWTDLDGDTDLDIFVAGDHFASVSSACINDGSGNFTIIATTVPGAWRSGRSVDIDNDADLDLVLIYLGSTRIYRNDGQLSFTEIMVNELPYMNFSSDVAWSDYNNDGLADALCAGGSYSTFETQVLRNEGNEQLTDIKAVLNRLSGAVAMWADYDNDGDFDFATTGDQYHPSWIYRNDGTSGFFPINTNMMMAPNFGSTVWGDYDADGLADLLVTGASSVNGYSYISMLYRNVGSDTFVNVDSNLPGLYGGYTAWGDCNLDGMADVLMTGDSNNWRGAGVYLNVGNAQFTESEVVPMEYIGQMGYWGDYDRDGDLDALFSGTTSSLSARQYILRNDGSVQNRPPEIPNNLVATCTSDTVTFSWASTHDDYSPSPTVSYNLRVGTTPGGCDVLSPMATAEGVLLVPRPGNAGNVTMRTLHVPACNVLYWSVQAIDGAFAASGFASEQVITPETIPGATISGHLYNDVNWNEVQDQGEADLANILVRVSSSCDKWNYVESDVNGNFSSSVTSGKVVVSVDESDDDLPADFMPVTVAEVTYTLVPGEHRDLRPLGFAAQNFGTIMGFVFHDVNEDGVLNGGDSGIAGVQVYVFDSEGHMKETLTREDGLYQFTTLAGYVRIVADTATLPPGSSLTTVSELTYHVLAGDVCHVPGIGVRYLQDTRANLQLHGQSDMTWSQKQPSTRLKIKVPFVIGNSGHASAPVTTLHAYLSADYSLDAEDVLIKGVRVKPLLQGKSKSLRFSLVIPGNQAANYLGKLIILKCDADEAVVEASETDNHLIFGPIPTGN